MDINKVAIRAKLNGMLTYRPQRNEPSLVIAVVSLEAMQMPCAQSNTLLEWMKTPPQTDKSVNSTRESHWTLTIA